MAVSAWKFQICVVYPLLSVLLGKPPHQWLVGNLYLLDFSYVHFFLDDDPQDYNFPGGLKHVWNHQPGLVCRECHLHLHRHCRAVGSVHARRGRRHYVVLLAMHHACVGTDSTSLCGLDEELFWIHHSIPGRLWTKWQDRKTSSASGLFAGFDLCSYVNAPRAIHLVCCGDFRCLCVCLYWVWYYRHCLRLFFWFSSSRAVNVSFDKATDSICGIWRQANLPHSFFVRPWCTMASSWTSKRNSLPWPVGRNIMPGFG